MNERALRSVVWVLLAFVAGAFDPVLIKWAYRDHVSPVQLLFLKNAFSALLVMPFVFRLSADGLSRRNLLICGTLLFITQSLYLLALGDLSVVLVITIITTTPALVALINASLGREVLEGGFWLGFLLCCLGVVLTVDSGEVAAHTASLVCACVAAVSSAVYRVLMESVSRDHSPSRAAASTLVVQGLLSLGFIPWMGTIPVSALNYGGLLAGCSAFGNIAFVTALSLIGSTRISLLGMLQRPAMVVVAALFVGEAVTLAQACGVILAIAGVQLARVRPVSSLARG